MLEGSVDQDSDWWKAEKQTSPISMIAGTSALVLVLPAAVIALLELMDQIEYNEFKWVIYSMIYSLTIISILLISGLNLVGFLQSDNLKMSAGIYLIALSGINLLLRFLDLNDQLEMNKEWGYWGDLSWFEFMQWPQTHERLELAVLGIIIGALIMKK